MTEKSFTVGIDGALGVVGKELADVLAERGFECARMLAFGDEEQFGEAIDYKGGELPIRNRSTIEQASLDLLFIVPPAPGYPLVERRQAECLVIDGTGHAFHKDENVPLIVPEINSDAIEQGVEEGVIAIPSALATGLAVACNPLHKEAGIARMVVTTFEPVSQWGLGGIDLFTKQVHKLLAGHEDSDKNVAEQLAFNFMPRVDTPEIDAESGSRSSAEQHLVKEVKTLLDIPAITAVRTTIPVFYGAAAIVYAEFDKALSVKKAKELLRNAPGLMLMDEKARQPVTMREVVGSDATFVGRIQKDDTVEHGLVFYVAIDNLRKGSATNMVQIAEIARRDYM